MSTRASWPSEGRLGPVAVVSPAWGRTGDEMAYVMRQVVSALTRIATVEVFVPGGSTGPDGAFDVFRLESATPQSAPYAQPGEHQLRNFSVILVDDGNAEATRIAEVQFPGVRVISVGAAGSDAVAAGARKAPLLSAGVGQSSQGVYQVGSLVAVHLGVSRWQRVRSGIEYVAVLGDGGPLGRANTKRLVGRLARRFPVRRFVVAGNGSGRLWRYGVPVTRGPVSSRTDLWRVMAHAMMTIDLAPGTVISRECIESLRLGVPILVPAGSALHLVNHGGGRSFESDDDLLRQVAALMDPRVREELGSSGRALADEWYGDPSAFVARVGDAVRSVVCA